MKLQEIFDALTYGELSQLSIGGGEAGVIDATNYPRVLNHVNLGITALYRRFNLKEGRVTLQLQPDVVQYKITSAFAQSNARSREVVKYLDDSAAPFADDILKIEQVLVDSGWELVLNDSTNVYSVTTPSATVLRVPIEIVNQDPCLPDELKTAALQLVYRAAHPKLVVPIGFFDPARVDVQLPDSYLEALCYFVASRVSTPMGAGQLEGAGGNNWFQKYEAECQRLSGQNLEVDRIQGNTRIDAGGWV